MQHSPRHAHGYEQEQDHAESKEGHLEYKEAFGRHGIIWGVNF